ncbi:MAG: hypothetical protein K0A99_03095 [Desulfoarculaceae bacterium]|nr:hypothetical protein [Desulfoarculaceae bacterium]
MVTARKFLFCLVLVFLFALQACGGDSDDNGGGEVVNGGTDAVTNGGDEVVNGGTDAVTNGGDEVVNGGTDDVINGGDEVVNGGTDDVINGGDEVVNGGTDDVINDGDEVVNGGTNDVINDGDEVINGVKVPPVPDATANQETVAGVDANNNGVRDDVERMIATEFGSDQNFYPKAMNYAIAEQAAILTPTPENISASLDQIRCESDDQVLNDLSKISDALLDTPERCNAYANAFAGAVFSSEGCQQ